MASPDDRRYLESHEWHKLENGLVTIGISRFAVDELTDVTYLDIPDPTATLAKGDRFGEIESVKATSELYVGLAGAIVEVNPAVIENPALINDDPYDKGWMVKVKPDNPADLDALLCAADYDKMHS